MIKAIYSRLVNWVKAHQRLSIYGASFLLPCAIMLGVWFFNQQFPFGPKSHMAVDFGQQYIGFYAYLKDSLLSGNLGALVHSFEKSIGGEMIGVLGYYLMSPFNLLYVLLPLSQFKWAIFLTILLRYGFTGLTFAHLLVKRYQGAAKNQLFVPIFAAAYALSGMIVAYQMNPIFYDAMIWLPLVITYLEEFLEKKSTFKYVIVLALAVLSQFYMGYMICLFVALYAFYYLAPALEGKDRKQAWANYTLPIFNLLGYSLLAVATTAVLLYPIVLNLLRSKGAYEAPLTFAFGLQINPLDILSKLFIGGFDDQSWAAGPNLPNIFVGSLALIGFILYFHYSKAPLYRKWAAGFLSGFFLLSFVHEFTSKLWHMGQNPAGFFHRFSWIVSFFMVLLAFQTLQSHRKLKPAGLFKGVGIALLAVTYVVYKDYSYLKAIQAESLTTFVLENKRLVYLLMIGLLLAIGYWIHKRAEGENRLDGFPWKSMVLTALLMSIAAVYLMKGYLFGQILLTLLTWVLALLFYQGRFKTLGKIVVIGVTILELGYNAYLSQKTLGYTDAHKFGDLAVKLSRMSDTIEDLNKDGSRAPFYRVGTDFLYSKVDPLIGSYNGLSNFSSSLEKSTIDLFSSFGEVAGNASTFYANGTALTDAFFSVRYYVARKDYTNEDVENNPRTHFFNKHSTRKDLTEHYTKVYEDETFIIYENPDVLPLAFATNQLTHNINFGLNNPVSNQNIILDSMANETKTLFQHLSFDHIDLENMVEVDENGEKFYRRIDKSQPGTIRFRFTPQDDYTYYFQAPLSLRSSMGNISITLNDQWYNYTQGFDQIQLWNLAHQSAGKEVVLQFQTSVEDQLNFTNFSLVRADFKGIKEVLKKRSEQGLRVESFSDTRIKGAVTVTDDSNIMMTSIPYNPGWRVKVDGQRVETTKAWGSLLAFPISSGEHTVELSFVTPGLLSGLLISLVSVGILVSLYRSQKKDGDTQI